MSKLITKILGNKGWEIIERNNAAWGLPSDFSLIKVDFTSNLISLPNGLELPHQVILIQTELLMYC